MPDLALQAADRLAGMVNPTVGVIPVGSQAEIAAGLDDVTIDCMVNLPLLWWAWKTTLEERLKDIAVSHADCTAGWHVKEDGRIIQSVKKTGRLVVVHEAVKRGGFGGEIAGIIAEEAFDYLDAPIKRVAGKNVPIAFNEVLERKAVPDVDDIVLAGKSCFR
jgi:pyruvate dehydrogenase E1 component beta subunit